MKKIYLIPLVLLIIGIAVFIIYSFMDSRVELDGTTNQATSTLLSPTTKTPNVKNITYLIDDQPVTLVDGLSEIDIADSSSKQVTRYFGNEATGDLNGDGKNDVAFILTQDSGGSGIFYYIAVALANDNGYEGINAILLGDRIAPQTTNISEGKINVNYADRKIGESFSVQPTVGVSKYFQVINNKLVDVTLN